MPKRKLSPDELRLQKFGNALERCRAIARELQSLKQDCVHGLLRERGFKRFRLVSTAPGSYYSQEFHLELKRGPSIIFRADGWGNQVGDNLRNFNHRIELLEDELAALRKEFHI